jgi:hypothetical protein
MEDVVALPLDSRSRDAEPELTTPLPPPQSATNHAAGFFRKIGAFFSSLFH